MHVRSVRLYGGSHVAMLDHCTCAQSQCSHCTWIVVRKVFCYLQHLRSPKHKLTMHARSTHCTAARTLQPLLLRFPLAVRSASGQSAQTTEGSFRVCACGSSRRNTLLKSSKTARSADELCASLSSNNLQNPRRRLPLPTERGTANNFA